MDSGRYHGGYRHHQDINYIISLKALPEKLLGLPTLDETLEPPIKSPIKAPTVTDLLRHSDTILIEGWMQALMDGLSDIEPEDTEW